MQDWRIERFRPGLEHLFLELHDPTECFCTAWHVQSWDSYCKMTKAEKLEFREDLLSRGEYDGYLCISDDRGVEKAVGWMQVGPRNRLEKLRKQFELENDPAPGRLHAFW